MLLGGERARGRGAEMLLAQWLELGTIGYGMPAWGLAQQNASSSDGLLGMQPLCGVCGYAALDKHPYVAV